MLKLSIIIPAYNVAPYIEKCIESIIHQQLGDFKMEVIIINDGSKDNTQEKIENLLQKYPQIIFINQENQGVSEARNRGLEIAKGEYVLFVDPDDYLHPHSILPILKKADSEKIDMLYLKMDLCDEAYQYLYTYEKCGEENEIKTGLEHPRRTFPATLYRRDLIGKIIFVKGVMRGQDSVFNAMVQSFAKRVSYYNNNYYIYLQRDTSSRQFVANQKTYDGCYIAISYLNNFRKLHFGKKNELANQFFDEIMAIFVQRILEWNVFPNFDKEKFIEIKKYLKAEKLNHLIKKVNKIYPFLDKPFFVFKRYYLNKEIKSKIHHWIND